MGTRAGLEYPEGDPDSLADAADRLWSLAAAVTDAAGRVARSGRVADWRGKASTNFAAVAEQYARPLVTGADTLHRAGRAVAELAEEMGQAQRRIRRWAEEIEEAQRQARAAWYTALSPTRVLADRVGRAFGLPPDAQQSRYGLAEEKVAELRARYAPKARQLCEQIEHMDRRTSSAVLAAADAAPAGGAGVPGAPKVPIDVLVYAPVFLFAAGELYLAAEPRFQDVDNLSADDLRGQGAGAPIFYRVRWFGNEKIIEYWVYRRHNEFFPVPDHPDDSEGVAVRIRDGRPVQYGYTQHMDGCSLPWADTPKIDGHPKVYPGLLSGSMSPNPGIDRTFPIPGIPDEIRIPGIDRTFPIPGIPDEIRVPGIVDKHGPAPGEQTPPEHEVHAGDHLVSYQGGQDWQPIDPEGDRVPGNDHNSKKFDPGSSESVWSETCESLPSRRGDFRDYL